MGRPWCLRPLSIVRITHLATVGPNHKSTIPKHRLKLQHLYPSITIDINIQFTIIPLKVKVKVLSQSQPSWLILLAESTRRLAEFPFPENSHNGT